MFKKGQILRISMPNEKEVHNALVRVVEVNQYNKYVSFYFLNNNKLFNNTTQYSASENYFLHSISNDEELE